MNFKKALNYFEKKCATMQVTPNQKQVYTIIAKMIDYRCNWHTCTLQISNTRLTEVCGFSDKNTTRRAYKALEQKGFLRIESGKADHTYSKYTLIFE